MLAFLGATASVGQVALWLADVSGGPAVAIVFSVLVPLGLVFAVTSALPAGEVKLRHESIGSTLSIRVGDLFDTPSGAIVVTMNRHFDTNMNRVAQDSLIGQFKSRYSDNAAVVKFLASSSFRREVPAQVGEVVDFRWGDKRYLFLAVASRSAETRSSVVIDELWDAFNSLWKYARRNDIAKLALPIIGAGFANAQVGQSMLLTLLLASYSTASSERRVADLDLVIRQSDAFNELLEFAKNYCELVGFKVLESRSITGRQIEENSADGKFLAEKTPVNIA